MNPNDASTPIYYDRSTGLMVFGALTIGLGLLCGLMAAFIPVAHLLTERVHQPGITPLPMSAMVPGLVVYGLMSVALIWLGIGSCLCRRWARAILCAFSWSWLIVGITAIVMAAFILPTTMSNATAAAAQMQGHPAPPAGMMTALLVVIFAVYGVIFVALPAAWTFFYNSHHVKATCDYRDPVPRWTDQCPLPVLAVCLWAGMSVPMMVIMAAAGHLVMPVFGYLASGLIASILYLLVAVIWGLCATLFYRLNVLGWWLLLVTMLIMMISSLITYSVHGMDEMYRLMGYPEAQVQLISKLGMFKGHSLTWISTAFFVPVVGYLIFIKRYFKSS